MANLATAPPAPFLPQDVHGRRVVVVSGCHSGAPEEGANAFRPLKEFGAPIADLIGPMQYTEMQRFVDGQWGPGFHNYFKSSWLAELNDAAIEQLLRAHERAASPETKMQLYHFGGAVARIPRDETAFAHRDVPFLLNIAARWSEAAESDLHIGWAKGIHEAMRRFSTGGVYVNFLGDEGPQRVAAAYGEPTYQRLLDLKRSYDATNLFRVNQNIPPDRQAP